jgi:hypothetical protein
VIYTEPLAEEHRAAVARFRCTRYPYAEELVEFPQQAALREQQSRLSSTTLFFSDDSDEIDGFVTMSTSSIRTPPDFRKQHPERAYLPIVFLDYVAVADHRLAAERGFGHKLFTWALNKVVGDADAIGARLLMLEVRVGNWHAYQRYKHALGIHAAPPSRQTAHRTARSPVGRAPARL